MKMPVRLRDRVVEMSVPDELPHRVDVNSINHELTQASGFLRINKHITYLNSDKTEYVEQVLQ